MGEGRKNRWKSVAPTVLTPATAEIHGRPELHSAAASRLESEALRLDVGRLYFRREKGPQGRDFKLDFNLCI